MGFTSYCSTNCYVPAESAPAEPRAALTPATAQILVKLGITVQAAPGLGRASHYSDEDYIKAGVILVSDHAAALASADLVLRVRKPPVADVARMQRGALHLSFLDPFNEKELLAAFAAAGVSAVSLEMIPRTTQAQKMDALSSQASLAGYSAVIEAAQRLRMALPMMMTPAGTIISARVFIIGAGVAGLQAIATAKRLGARVEAFDTRPVVEEQVKSLGGKFVKIDLGETSQTGGRLREGTHAGANCPAAGGHGEDLRAGRHCHCHRQGLRAPGAATGDQGHARRDETRQCSRRHRGRERG